MQTTSTDQASCSLHTTGPGALWSSGLIFVFWIANSAGAAVAGKAAP
jgi:hypothetical protein